MLSEFDISQDVFLDLIVTLNESLGSSPYHNAINLASFAGEASPEPLIGLLIGEAVERVTTAIMEVQSRMKSNEFLDEFNEGFFAPRGLFAFVGTWRPNRGTTERALTSRVDEGAIPSHPHVSILAESTVIGGSKRVATKGGWKNFQIRVQRAMLPAGGEFTAIVPETLVWPSAEEIAAASPGRRTEDKIGFIRAGVWVDEYIDKQSQVSWTQGNHGHMFAGSLPKPEVRSRYADPSQAASSGDVVTLPTGGRWDIKGNEKKAKEQARKQLEKEKKKEKRLKSQEQEAGYDADQSRVKAETGGLDYSEAKQDGQASSSIGERRVKETVSSGLSNLLEGVGRAFHRFTCGLQGSLTSAQNVLYLVIVKNPSLADNL